MLLGFILGVIVGVIICCAVQINDEDDFDR